MKRPAAPPTEKQKRYLRLLCEREGIRYAPADTRAEVSEQIARLLHPRYWHMAANRREAGDKLEVGAIPANQPAEPWLRPSPVIARRSDADEPLPTQLHDLKVLARRAGIAVPAAQTRGEAAAALVRLKQQIIPGN